MLRNCRKPLLILCSVIVLGTSVATAEQGGQSISKSGNPAEIGAGGSGSKKSRHRGPQVGQPVDGGQLHRVSRPGLYGMSQPPAGSAYGIVDDRLIRFDPESGHVLSIIRQVDRILD